MQSASIQNNGFQNTTIALQNTNGLQSNNEFENTEILRNNNGFQNTKEVKILQGLTIATHEVRENAQESNRFRKERPPKPLPRNSIKKIPIREEVSPEFCKIQSELHLQSRVR